MMYAVASLLRSWEDAPAEDLWEQFTAICSVVETKNTPAPHFSWQAASAYRIEFVKQELASLVNELTPFSIYIDGIGVFTGATPLLYLTLIKTKQLQNLHEQVWCMLGKYATDMHMQYAPERWIPHITLAHPGPSTEGFECIVTRLAYQPLEFELVVDNLALLSQTGPDAGVVAEYRIEKPVSTEPD